MKQLPRDVWWLGRLLLPAEAAEVILGDLQEERGERFGEERRMAGAIWLRSELLRSVAAVLREGARRRLAATRGRPGDGGRAGTTGRTTMTGTGRRVVPTVRVLAEDLRFALRGLVRAPAFSLFALATLALGIGSATAVYSAVERVIVNPLPYPDSDRMVLLWRTTDGDVVFIPEMKHVRAWREMEAFERIEVYRAGQATLTGRGSAQRLRVKAVSDGYFDLLAAEPVLGRGFTPDEQRGEGARVAVLSHELWASRFGGARDAVGQTLVLDDEPWTVVGVLPPRVHPPNSGPGLTDVWTPLGQPAEGSVWPLALLRPGVDLERANERLTALAEGAPDAGLGPSADWKGRAFDAAGFGRGRVAGTLRTLFVAVLLLLLVAAVNVSSLLFQRARGRARETAVRAALGAGRARLVREVVLEGLLLAAAGGMLGLGLAAGATQAVAAARPESIGWLLDGLRIDARVLAFGFAVAGGAGLVASLLPALRLLRGGGAGALLRSRQPGGDSSGGGVRWALVAGEVGLSFALLTGTVMVIGSLGDMRGQEPGYTPEGLVEVSVTLPEWRYESEEARGAAFRAMAAELGREPGVEGVAVADALPPGLPGTLARLHPEGRDPAEETTFVREVAASPGFLALLGQPLLAGRDLRASDEVEGTRSVVVGRTLARRLFPEAEPDDVVGRRFAMGPDEEPLIAVGVAGDIRANGLAYDAAVPLVYRPRTRWPRSQVLAVRLAPSVEAHRWAGTAGVRERVRSVAPDAVVEVEAATDALAGSLVQERFTALLMAAFAALAIFLAGVGLYGVLAQAVTGRTREIGIRMSLGADRAAVRRLVLRGGAGATAAGLVGGAVLAHLGLELLSSTVFGLDVARPEAYLLAGAALALVALLATWLPARRATRLDPSIAMRTD